MRSRPRLLRFTSIRATDEEKTRSLPGDERICQPIDTLTHGITIRRSPRDVWPWLVQMGAGERAGWYSYDWLDNGRRPSATRIVHFAMQRKQLLGIASRAEARASSRVFKTEREAA